MVIINKGSTIVEGNVQELLNEGLLKVNFTVDKPKKALECLNTSRFNSSNILITDTAITIETEQSFISDINSLLVENDIVTCSNTLHANRIEWSRKTAQRE